MLAIVLKILMAGVVAGSIDVIRKNGEVDIEDKWNKLMLGAGIKTKGDDGATYSILKKIKRMYGHDIIVGIPDGMTYTGLEGLEEQIKISYKCKEINMEYKHKSSCAYIRLISKPICDDTPFQPIQVKPWEVYLGTTKYYKDVVVDMRTFPHILIAGTTGAGKSLFTVQVLLNMIVNHNSKECQIYLSEISDKDDFKLFRNCETVKGYARNLEDTVKMLKHLYDTMGVRNKLFNEFDDISNLHEYNQRFPYKKLPWIYFFTDEYSLFMEDDSDTDKESFLKKQCQAYMKKLAKLARNTGIFILSSLQRPDRENMPPIFKTNLSVIVAFKQRNGASALTVLDSYKPMELEYREAIVDFGGNQSTIYSLFINSYIVKCYLEGKNEKEHEYVDLSEHEWLVKQSENYKKDKNKKEGQYKDTVKKVNNVEYSKKDKKSKSKGVIE